MNECYHDKFDSQMLGRNVYKLQLRDEVADAAELRSLYAGEPAEVLFCFSEYSPRNSAALQAEGFSFISIRNTYELKLDAAQVAKLTSSTSTTPADVDLVMASDGVPELPPQDLLGLAETLGETSRYFKDTNIPRETSLKVYQAWLHNSLYNGYANDVVLAMKDSASAPEMAGIHTLKWKNGTGVVDLIGVQPRYQQHGLGRALLQAGLRTFTQHGLTCVEVVTEGENVPASRFYQKNGFLLRSVQLVWHKHLR